MTARSPELDAFFKAKSAEIDVLYRQYADKISGYYFADMTPSPIKLTARQKLRVYMWRLRSACAAPFVWVVKLLDPSRLASEDD